MCGGPADTRDHVPPKRFFPEPLPPNLVTVPACLQCNRGFSAIDERARAYFTSLAISNATGRKVLVTKVLAPKSLTGAAFGAILAAAERRTDAQGIEETVLSFPRGELTKFVGRVIRGLVMRFYPSRHDRTADILVVLLPSAGGSGDDADRSLKTALRMPRRTLGDGVVDFFISSNRPSPLFVISFYQGITFLGFYGFERRDLSDADTAKLALLIDRGRRA